jgi:hypothetical protein
MAKESFMKIPNAATAVVTEDKICRYLLEASHPDNGGKAAFFHVLGFTTADWMSFASALQELARNSNFTGCFESLHGAKYIVDGLLTSPTGQDALVRTVWIIDRGETTPRLVTAYPIRGKREP